MAMPTSRFIRLPTADHDDRAVPQRRLAVHQTLVAGRRAAAHDADRLELVYDLSDAHQDGHRAKGQAAEVDVRPGEDHPDTPIGEAVRQIDDPVVEELGLVHGDDLGAVTEPAGDLFGRVHRLGFDGHAVMRRDGKEPGVARI